MVIADMVQLSWRLALTNSFVRHASYTTSPHFDQTYRKYISLKFSVRYFFQLMDILQGSFWLVLIVLAAFGVGD